MNVKEFFEKELESRQVKNMQYSKRAFARDMGLSPSYFSELLKGHYKLSEKKALKVAENLKFSPEKRLLFLNVIKLNLTEDSFTRNKILEEIKVQTKKLSVIEEVTEAQFRVISKWYVGGVFALVAQKNGKINVNMIAETFQVKLSEAEELMNDLQVAGMLKWEESRYVQSAPWYRIPEIPSFCIQKYHTEHLQKAQKALRSQSIENRDFSGTTYSFSSKHMEELKSLLRECRERVAQFTLNIPEEEKDSIYHLAIQFYRLDD